jgi:hypothetical protein
MVVDNVTRKCKYCGEEIEGVVPAPSTCWTCYKEIGTESVDVSEQFEDKNVEEIGIGNDESVTIKKSDILFTGSGVYLRKVPISKISSILVDLRKKMDPDFSLNINTEGEVAEIFLSEDQLLYWAKKTFKAVISDFIE